LTFFDGPVSGLPQKPGSRRLKHGRSMSRVICTIALVAFSNEAGSTKRSANAAESLSAATRRLSKETGPAVLLAQTGRILRAAGASCSPARLQD
jgi:hypothetical protein